MTNTKTLFERVISFFKGETTVEPEQNSSKYFLFGEHEKYSLYGTVKNPYNISNADEAETPLNQCYWGIKWSTYEKASCANASDFDALCLAYGAEDAKELRSQMSNPTSGHAVTIRSIESAEVSDFDALCNNQEKNLAALEEDYRMFERINNAWF